MDYKIEELLKKINELTAELNAAKKYGLVWDKENTKENVVQLCENNIPYLKAIDSYTVKNGTLNNILIQGDNYHSLLSLSFTMSESIDLIYIDPPYNTGNKAKDGGFKYNDQFVEKENAFRHSKWLTMMKRRLELARKLLSEFGVIFISIDDNEL